MASLQWGTSWSAGRPAQLHLSVTYSTQTGAGQKSLHLTELLEIMAFSLGRKYTPNNGDLTEKQTFFNMYKI